MIRYRTETAYGSKETDPVKVMCYETFELGNNDIVYTLTNELLKGHPVWNEWDILVSDILMQSIYIDKWGRENQIQFFQDILSAIKSVTGKDIKYVLWLADKDTVRDYYGGTDDDICGYPIGDVVLSELGYDGTLYGYEEFPQAV